MFCLTFKQKKTMKISWFLLFEKEKLITTEKIIKE
jgi:hypothetical protein